MTSRSLITTQVIFGPTYGDLASQHRGSHNRWCSKPKIERSRHPKRQNHDVNHSCKKIKPRNRSDATLSRKAALCPVRLDACTSFRESDNEGAPPPRGVAPPCLGRCALHRAHGLPIALPRASLVREAMPATSQPGRVSRASHEVCFRG